MNAAIRSSSRGGTCVPVGFAGEPINSPRVRGPHAARTMSRVG
jgi:hypothetical protein